MSLFGHLPKPALVSAVLLVVDGNGSGQLSVDHKGASNANISRRVVDICTPMQRQIALLASEVEDTATGSQTWVDALVARRGRMP